MTKRISKYDWRRLPINEWTVTTFLRWFQYETRNRYGVEYEEPNDYRERRMLKHATTQYGNEAVRDWIAESFESYVSTKKYPFMQFGFIYVYRRDRLKTIAIEKGSNGTSIR
ncbi:hypothetical protein JMM81_07080 [Bacillus sp. V3B]|uniref:hypothetical protein n=1 Tax=Bacillus sp. V3B TaxID=2804915 RepID=UPI002108EA5A|nr:hypothetical protein [Bacillus sp. V3B]MCQ6274733.1 hypothetical protein [Bacillus sp. V3B]